MANHPHTLMGWSRKLYKMRGGKFKIRVIGWKTPFTRPGSPFGLTVPKNGISSFRDVPKSATKVTVVLIRTDGNPSRLISVSRDRLEKEYYLH